MGSMSSPSKTLQLQTNLKTLWFAFRWVEEHKTYEDLPPSHLERSARLHMTPTFFQGCEPATFWGPFALFAPTFLMTAIRRTAAQILLAPRRHRQSYQLTAMRRIWLLTILTSHSGVPIQICHARLPMMTINLTTSTWISQIGEAPQA